MPTVNVYSNDSVAQFEEVIVPLKEFVAKELTCGDITLDSNEVSVRFINANGSGMLAPVEVEINPAAFSERVQKQEDICLNIQKFLIDKLQIEDVKVWLILSELGHSWE